MSPMEERVSDEIINAFVDGELSAEERSELLERATHSDELKQRICEVQYLKQLVCEAYPIDAPASQHVMGRRQFFGHALAAGVGGIAAFAGMSLLGSGDDRSSNTAERLASAVSQPGGYSRVVFHISDNNPQTAEELLDQVELVLGDFTRRGKALKVEVVANNEGLRLLQLGRSYYPERIARLDAAHNNLLFAACGNTIERLERENDEEIEILPQAVVINSGVMFVARRQQQGWAYIKV